MSRDTQVTDTRDTSAVVRCRLDRLDAFMNRAGRHTITARAELIGVPRRSLQRVQQGRVRPGERFMALTVAALRGEGIDVSLDDLFEVVEERAA